MEARALSVAFRHQPAPEAQTFGPEPVTIDGTTYPASGRLVLEESAAPAWSTSGPTGFSFRYVVPEDQRAAFLAEPLHGVAVRLHRLYQLASGVWIEERDWRFEGVITAATYAPENGVLACTATPWSRTRQARPTVPGWSHQEQLDLTAGADTLLRWTRASRRANTPIEEA